MTSPELRKKFLEFFEKKGHKIIPSASLIPENDPTTLFTGSGMQPMIAYLLGEKHPQGSKLVNSQRCFRSQDMDDVGDNRHTTFFEMLGNWSLGDYWKKEQLNYFFDFLTKEVGLNSEKLYISVFKGKEELGISEDNESIKIWQNIFNREKINSKVVDLAEQKGMQAGRIFYYDECKNWWSRSGIPENMPEGEPGGPDSEVFYDFGEDLQIHENSVYKDKPCHPNCDCGRFMEIGNNVFMEYIKTKNGFEKLPQRNVDFGGGLERILAAKLNTPDIFKTDLFEPIIKGIEKLSSKKYGNNSEEDKNFRIIADHIKATVMIIGEYNGVEPSNLNEGYVVRKLLRRAIFWGDRLGLKNNFLDVLVRTVVEKYKNDHNDLETKQDEIGSVIRKEEVKFKETLEKGLKEFEKWYKDPEVYWPESDAKAEMKAKEKLNKKPKKISGRIAFRLFSTYGFPIELTEEIAKEKDVAIDIEDFKKEFKKHQEISKVGADKKFKGGLADNKEETKKLHTTTHLLQAALRKVLGNKVFQKGSNITAERLRFDFSYDEKMTLEQLKKVEDLVNKWIAQKIDVKCEELSYDKAKNKGAMGLFKDKYGDKVKVYSVSDVSIEMCGGPHVSNTSELGKFKIKSEKASSKGVRRIKAILE